MYVLDIMMYVLDIIHDVCAGYHDALAKMYVLIGVIQTTKCTNAHFSLIVSIQ